LLGSEPGTGQPPSIFYLNSDIELAYPPAAKNLGFFIQNFSTVVGKTFRVTLTGSGCGNQNPSKQGYFRIIPDNPFWKPGGNVGGNDVSIKPLGQLEDMRLSPNPAHDQVNIEFNSADDAAGTLRIVSVDGKVMNTESEMVSFAKGRNVISRNIQTLPTGTYLIQIVKSGSVHSQKLVKLQ